jgi:hypothetical protein
MARPKCDFGLLTFDWAQTYLRSRHFQKLANPTHIAAIKSESIPQLDLISKPRQTQAFPQRGPARLRAFQRLNALFLSSTPLATRLYMLGAAGSGCLCFSY